MLIKSISKFHVAFLLIFGTCGCSSSSTSSDSDNTAAVVSAVNTFLGTLSTSQQTTAKLDYTSTNAETWSNLPITMATRNGVQFSDLSSTQLDAALAVVKAAMSTAGYTLFTAVRTADDKLATINSSTWGSGKYFIAILGTPSTSSAWMLQVGGHHIAYNMTYHGSATNGTPMFVGIDPPQWTDSSGTQKPLETQRAAVDALAQSILGNSSAILSGNFDDVVMGPNGTGNHDTNYPQSYPTSSRGLVGSSLTSSQKTLVKTAIEAWVNILPSSVATSLLAVYETDDALNSTYVALGQNANHTVDFSANPTDASGKGSYLRIDGPRVWIEFVVQIGAFNNQSIHYHTLWRDKQSDYGAEFK